MSVRPRNQYDRRTHTADRFRAGGGAYVARYVRAHLVNVSDIAIIRDKDTTRI